MGRKKIEGRPVHEWGEIVELNQVNQHGKDVSPIVFNFRPTRFLKVAPERLKDWEEFFGKNIGLRPDKELAAGWSGDPKETISGSNDDWDDCDYW